MRSLGLVLMLSAMMVSADEISTLSAVVRLSSPSGLPVVGNVTFTQPANGHVRVTGRVVGRPPGSHIYHVHQKGDITGGCASPGPHYSPGDVYEVGDLGSLNFDDNKMATIDFEHQLLNLSGPQSIIGRSVVLHEKLEDPEKSEQPDPKKPGYGWNRIACGVIGVL